MVCKWSVLVQYKCGCVVAVVVVVCVMERTFGCKKTSTQHTKRCQKILIVLGWIVAPVKEERKRKERRSEEEGQFSNCFFFFFSCGPFVLSPSSLTDETNPTFFVSQ